VRAPHAAGARNIFVGFADVTRASGVNLAHKISMSRKFAYDVRHVARVSCKCCALAQQGMLRLDPSVRSRLLFFILFQIAKYRSFQGSSNNPITIVPFLANEDGSLLTYDISGTTQHHRTRRGTDQESPADIIYVVVPMEKETVILDLHRTSHLVAPVAIAETSGNGTFTGRRIRDDCFYQGRIRGMTGSRVAVSSCHGLVSSW
jgi:hypothetical protein